MAESAAAAPEDVAPAEPGDEDETTTEDGDDTPTAEPADEAESAGEETEETDA